MSSIKVYVFCTIPGFAVPWVHQFPGFVLRSPLAIIRQKSSLGMPSNSIRRGARHFTREPRIPPELRTNAHSGSVCRLRCTNLSIAGDSSSSVVQCLGFVAEVRDLCYFVELGPLFFWDDVRP